jgi:hypothetical protein
LVLVKVKGAIMIWRRKKKFRIFWAHKNVFHLLGEYVKLSKKLLISGRNKCLKVKKKKFLCFLSIKRTKLVHKTVLHSPQFGRSSVLSQLGILPEITRLSPAHSYMLIAHTPGRQNSVA